MFQLKNYQFGKKYRTGQKKKEEKIKKVYGDGIMLN
jgi:hypothetical protein